MSAGGRRVPFRSIGLLPLVLLAVAGCPQNGDDDGPPGVMEIGIRGADGTFQPLAPGDTTAVVLGANGLNMIQPSLRSAEIDPRSPDPTVTVTVGGIVMAADIEGARVQLENDGTGYVLWDLRVPFQTELCCYICRPATVQARFRDASGRLFEGQVDVNLSRGECPDPPACCATADSCPDPSLTLLCM